MVELNGVPITLFVKTLTGTDAFGAPIYAETEQTVNDVLIAPVSSQDATEAYNMTGKRAVFEIAIPKGDTHDWENAKVGFFGKVWKTIGIPKEGIERMIPLRWNKKIQVERWNDE